MKRINPELPKGKNELRVEQELADISEDKETDEKPE